jgi:RNA polymerase sigma-70 factor (sigma-E family)
MGDASFEELFDALFGKAQFVAHRIVGDRALAEDLAAEAFARAYARWSSLRDEPGREGWVLRVTGNLAIDATRRRRPVLPDVPWADPGDAVALRMALVAALRALPGRQRSVVVLRYLADLSEVDTAVALHISEGSVKTHLHRGLARLRRELGEPNQEVPVALGPA